MASRGSMMGDSVNSTVEKAKERWRLFWELAAGHRFQTRYHRRRRQHERGETSRYGWILNLVGGVALVVAGFVFLPTPGPSYIIIVIGLWMLAGEWLSLARLFDRVEVRLRKLGRWVAARWRGTTASGKATFLALIATGVAALGYWLFS
jgi:hypothetical protein